MRHDPGLAASPPVRYMLRVERNGHSPFPLIVRCGRTTSSRSGGAPRTAVPSAQEDLPRAYGCSRARSGLGPPLSARIWDPSITDLDQSSAPAAGNSASNDSCSCCQTPASFPLRNRRQQVIPDPNPSSCGRNSQRNPRREHKQDPTQHLAIVQSPPTGMVGSTRHDRQQRLNPRPQLVRDDPGRLLTLPRSTNPTPQPIPRSFCWEFLGTRPNTRLGPSQAGGSEPGR
jgi:hypothetical protein